MAEKTWRRGGGVFEARCQSKLSYVKRLLQGQQLGSPWTCHVSSVCFVSILDNVPFHFYLQV